MKDEWRLIQDALLGDSAAFGDLVRRYQDRLYTAVVHITGCRAEAEDVVQDAFVQAYVNLKSFKHNSKFYTWLYRIAFNAAISRRRRKRVTLSVDQNREATGDEPLDHQSAPSHAMELAEQQVKLQQAMDRLSEEHRAIIVLRHLDESSYEDIAEILGISVGTVRSRLHRARAQLLDHLKDVLPDEVPS